MGYFVQIAIEDGSPIFQAFKNYPDVSFASSALFHALVTASLEQGFVPSVLRSKDASIALAVYGLQGGRISIALVTSEMSAGQTRDLETELHWRLSVVYRGALLVAGGDLLRRQPTQMLQRLLSLRLAPIVASVMAEEPMPGVVGRVPRLGLSLHGTAVEWLARLGSADAALDSLLACLPAGSRARGGGSAGEAAEAAVAVLSWQGRALAATPAWRRLATMDQALLLSLANEVGPSTYERPTRSLALEEVDGLWLPTAGAGGVFVAGAAAVSEEEALRPRGVNLPTSSFSTTLVRHPQQYRLLSARLFPPADCLCALEACASCCDWMGSSSGTTVASSRDASTTSLGALEVPPTPQEATCFQAEEFSLVFSLLEPQPDRGTPQGNGQEAAPATSVDDLFASAELCEESMQELWRGLVQHQGGEGLLRCSSGHLIAVLLIDETSQDTLLIPSAVQRCTALPWTCLGRQRKAAAARRLLHWIHVLPRLSMQRPQQYICCETYAVGAVRREDGIHCWGVVDLDFDPDWHGDHVGEESTNAVIVPTTREKLDCRTSLDDPRACQVLRLLGELLQRLPLSADLWTVLGVQGHS